MNLESSHANYDFDLNGLKYFSNLQITDKH